ncbi:MAG: hypothetical protein DMG30_09110 [Acidobacteria bacterium]|nr:MAG: hypothetical protein DMG30_09110 [Acidobacteriota bacterium]
MPATDGCIYVDLWVALPKLRKPKDSTTRCELKGANSLVYLTELQKDAAEVARDPAAWMPGNYYETLARAGAPPGR